MEQKSKKSRSYCFTINNYTEEDKRLLVELSRNNCKYIIAGYEVGENNTPHIQGFVYFNTARYFTALKKNWLPRAHIEICKGNANQNMMYCEKDGNLFIEKGERPSQGMRTDLIDLKNEILNGKRVDDICIENPNIYHQYGRTLNKIEDIAFRKKFRVEMTEGKWYFGGTDLGKSHRAFKNFTPDTHYVLNMNDNGWWEGYTGQETVILNEFRGQLKFSELLDLVDKWPKSVKRRMQAPAPFISKLLIVTSSLPPEEVFYNQEGDSIDQLYRRFKVYKIISRDEEMEHKCSLGNTKPMSQIFETRII